MQSDKALQQTDPTLVKCLSGLPPYLVFRTYVLTNQIITQRLEELLLENEPKKERSSEAKFQEIEEAKKVKKYFYYGPTLSVIKAWRLSSKKNFYSKDQESEEESLKAGDQVKITNDYHSSTLGDDDREILVYVKHVESKLKEKYVVPLKSLLLEILEDEFLTI